jgi:hypothetical protein
VLFVFFVVRSRSGKASRINGRWFSLQLVLARAAYKRTTNFTNDTNARARIWRFFGRFRKPKKPRFNFQTGHSEPFGYCPREWSPSSPNALQNRLRNRPTRAVAVSAWPRRRPTVAILHPLAHPCPRISRKVPNIRILHSCLFVKFVVQNLHQPRPSNVTTLGEPMWGA